MPLFLHQLDVGLGNQLLGTTPLFLPRLGSGQFEFRFTEYGYEPKKETITLSNFRANAIHAKMSPTLGSISVVTIPANAKVFVDGYYKGTTSPAGAGSNASAPAKLSFGCSVFCCSCWMAIRSSVQCPRRGA